MTHKIAFKDIVFNTFYLYKDDSNVNTDKNEIYKLLDSGTNCRFNNTLQHITTCVYNERSVYIPISRYCDILFKITNISSIENIENIELYGNINQKLITINLNEDFVLPLYLLAFSQVHLKLTFNHMKNIPNIINWSCEGGFLMSKIRQDSIKNNTIVYDSVFSIQSNRLLSPLVLKEHSVSVINKNDRLYSFSFPYGCCNKLLYSTDQTSKTECTIKMGSCEFKANLDKMEIIPCFLPYASVSITSKEPFKFSFKSVYDFNYQYCYTIDKTLVKEKNDDWEICNTLE